MRLDSEQVRRRVFKFNLKMVFEGRSQAFNFVWRIRVIIVASYPAAGPLTRIPGLCWTQPCPGPPQSYPGRTARRHSDSLAKNFDSANNHVYLLRDATLVTQSYNGSYIKSFDI